MFCNLCSGKEWGNRGDRIGVRCLYCNSLERTRLIGLHLELLGTDFNSILHIAPEAGLVNYIENKFTPKRYILADLFPADRIQAIDLCHMDDWHSSQFDLIIHSHVLEHTKCSFPYTLFHLNRVLKDSGIQIACIPFMPGYYEEDLAPLNPIEAKRRFGQEDHVRKFGIQDKELHLGKYINLPPSINLEYLFGARKLRLHNIPESLWNSWSHSTILKIDKQFI
jgi:hypothetical protein